ncbi:hypothetical protein HDV57DRAFT_160255 [Trichoderma longibrachiatum]
MGCGLVVVVEETEDERSVEEEGEGRNVKIEEKRRGSESGRVRKREKMTDDASYAAAPCTCNSAVSGKDSVMPVVGSPSFVSARRAAALPSCSQSVPCNVCIMQSLHAEAGREKRKKRLSLVDSSAGMHLLPLVITRDAGNVWSAQDRNPCRLDGGGAERQHEPSPNKNLRFALRTRAAEASRLAELATHLWPSPGACVLLTRHSPAAVQESSEEEERGTRDKRQDVRDTDTDMFEP